MQLVKPDRLYESGWKAALKEFEAESQGGFWNVPEKPEDLDEYIRRTEGHGRGENLPDYWMPATTFWLVEGSSFLGHVNVRHKLVEWSERIGGHIGFAIRKSERKKGYGSRILELAKVEARNLGLTRVLVTCNEMNAGSRKIIEKNGGVFQDVNEVKGEQVRRYWIELS
jgi:predicted acetyltransferase